MKKYITFITIILGSIILLAQTPSQIRVKTDANNSLVVSSAAQVNPVTTTTFNNARLRVDANGNLVTTLGSTGQQLFANGTAAAPSIAFAADNNNDTGMYSFGNDTIGWSLGGTVRMAAGTGSLFFRPDMILGWSSTDPSTTGGDTNLTRAAAGKLSLSTGSAMYFPDGTAAAPSIAFGSDTTTGFYKQSSGATGFSSTGSNIVGFGAQGLFLGSGSVINFSSTTGAFGTTDTTIGRSAAGTITLTGTTPMIQLGGATSSSPAIRKDAANQVGFIAADASAYVNSRSLNVIGSGFVNATSGNIFVSSAAPSAPSSCGTSPVVTSNNGTVSFVVTGGTGGTATGCTVTMPTAATGWNCHITNITQTAAHRADRDTRQTASTTTSVTWEYVTVSTGAATAFTASDVFRGICFAY